MCYLFSVLLSGRGAPQHVHGDEDSQANGTERSP